MNQTLRFNPDSKRARRLPFDPAYGSPFPIAAPAACLVTTESHDGNSKQKVICFASKSDRDWLDRCMFGAMCNARRLTAFIMTAEEFAIVRAEGKIPLSQDLVAFLDAHPEI
jgi:hypothetical protein